MAEHIVTLVVSTDDVSDPQGWDWAERLGAREARVLSAAPIPQRLTLPPLSDLLAPPPAAEDAGATDTFATEFADSAEWSSPTETTWDETGWANSEPDAATPLTLEGIMSEDQESPALVVTSEDNPTHAPEHDEFSALGFPAEGETENSAEEHALTESEHVDSEDALAIAYEFPEADPIEEAEGQVLAPESHESGDEHHSAPHETLDSESIHAGDAASESGASESGTAESGAHEVAAPTSETVPTSESTDVGEWDEFGQGSEFAALATLKEPEPVVVPYDDLSTDERKLLAYQLFEGLWKDVCANAKAPHMVLLSRFTELTPAQMLTRLASTLDAEGNVPSPVDITAARKTADEIRVLDPETYGRA